MGVDVMGDAYTSLGIYYEPIVRRGIGNSKGLGANFAGRSPSFLLPDLSPALRRLKPVWAWQRFRSLIGLVADLSVSWFGKGSP